MSTSLQYAKELIDAGGADADQMMSDAVIYASIAQAEAAERQAAALERIAAAQERTREVAEMQSDDGLYLRTDSLPWGDIVVCADYAAGEHERETAFGLASDPATAKRIARIAGKAVQKWLASLEDDDDQRAEDEQGYNAGIAPGMHR